jgi:hypothetical protein
MTSDADDRDPRTYSRAVVLRFTAESRERLRAGSEALDRAGSQQEPSRTFSRATILRPRQVKP